MTSSELETDIDKERHRNKQSVCVKKTSSRAGPLVEGRE